jgi:hypothetical protein
MALNPPDDAFDVPIWHHAKRVKRRQPITVNHAICMTTPWGSRFILRGKAIQADVSCRRHSAATQGKGNHDNGEGRVVLIALLAILGVDLIVIVIFMAIVVGRRRWLKRQTGEFSGAVRVTLGDVHGLRSTWKRGSGRWVRDVLVWSKGPFLYRDYLVPVDGVTGERPARPGEVKRLGDEPVVTGVASGDSMIEVAASAEHRALVAGPFMAASAPAPLPET